MVNKAGKGGFERGRSGNPGGRPKAVSLISVEARKHALDCIRTLSRIARNGKSEQARIGAAVALLDRGFGKPSQSLELNFHADILQKRLSELTPDELRIVEERTIQISGGVGDDSEPELQLGNGTYDGIPP
jgi:hypothetical protein